MDGCGKGAKKISIHAPREGGDGRVTEMSCPPTHFNPRPPRGGRPAWGDLCDDIVKISIHAPREGGDVVSPVAM